MTQVTVGAPSTFSRSALSRLRLWCGLCGSCSVSVTRPPTSGCHERRQPKLSTYFLLLLLFFCLFSNMCICTLLNSMLLFFFSFCVYACKNEK